LRSADLPGKGHSYQYSNLQSEFSIPKSVLATRGVRVLAHISVGEAGIETHQYHVLHTSIRQEPIADC